MPTFERLHLLLSCFIALVFLIALQTVLFPVQNSAILFRGFRAKQSRDSDYGPAVLKCGRDDRERISTYANKLLDEYDINTRFSGHRR